MNESTKFGTWIKSASMENMTKDNLIALHKSLSNFLNSDDLIGPNNRVQDQIIAIEGILDDKFDYQIV